LRRAIGARFAARLGALLMKPAFAELKRVVDPENYGGAPLLGVSGIAVICHGGASKVALANGVRVAARFVDQRLTKALTQAIVEHREKSATAGPRFVPEHSEWVEHRSRNAGPEAHDEGAQSGRSWRGVAFFCIDFENGTGGLRSVGPEGR
jgi:hypothetical protein